MEWLLDRFGARTTKIWPFEVARALGTTVAAKAPRRLSGLPKKKWSEYWNNLTSPALSYIGTI